MSNMVQGKKPGDTNGTSKSKYQQPNMSFQRKDVLDSRGGNGGGNDAKSTNGESNDGLPAFKLTCVGNGFRTDSSISGNKMQGERTLQRWVPDASEGADGSLEASISTGTWDQFAENKRRFGITTDYDENIYTTAIDKSHPQYKQRVAEADRKAREIERSVATNSHVAEERVTDNLTGGDNGRDEEDKCVIQFSFPFLLAKAHSDTVESVDSKISRLSHHRTINTHHQLGGPLPDNTLFQALL